MARPARGLSRALADVRAELAAHGLIHLALAVQVSRSWRWSDHRERAFGLYYGATRSRQVGQIRLPALAVPGRNLLAWILRRLGRPILSRISLRSILRHEFGHALADAVDRIGRPGPPWGTGTYVSAYARTDPSEDLAETWAVFLARGGRLPPRADASLRRKWRALRTLILMVRCTRLSCAVTCPACGTGLWIVAPGEDTCSVCATRIRIATTGVQVAPPHPARGPWRSVALARVVARPGHPPPIER